MTHIYSITQSKNMVSIKKKAETVPEIANMEALRRMQSTFNNTAGEVQAAFSLASAGEVNQSISSLNSCLDSLLMIIKSGVSDDEFNSYCSRLITQIHNNSQIYKMETIVKRIENTPEFNIMIQR